MKSYKNLHNLICLCLFALCSSTALTGDLLTESPTANAQSVQPKPLHQPAPAYPPDLLKEEIEGRVAFSFAVKADGSVAVVKILSSTDPRMARPAEEAVLTWKYEPFILPPGQDVVWLKSSLDFTLVD